MPILKQTSRKDKPNRPNHNCPCMHCYLLGWNGNVFSKDQIESYLELKQEEQDRYRMTPHPVEFDMYYSC
jgi:hypothetical protein